MVNNSDKPFRILSLDGGGIRGIISALILQQVEKELEEKGTSLLEHFDMIAGTSTGSLLAAGVAIGKPIKDLIEMYEKEGETIFPYHGFWSVFNIVKRAKIILKYGLSSPKYDNEGLIKVLKKVLTINGKEVTLKDVGKNEGQEIPKPILLILAYDTLYRNTTFFTNYYDRKKARNELPWYLKQPLWKICVSSASAPTFFPGFELDHEEYLYANYDEKKIIKNEKGEEIRTQWSFPHVDGGVTANNPSLCAIAHALDLGYKLENISLLSIGAGQDTEPYEFKKMRGWGLIGWGTRISNVFMAGQGELQDRICKSLMGEEKYLRLQFELNQTVYIKEDIQEGNELYNKMCKEVLKGQKITPNQDILSALKEFAQKPVIENKYLRKNSLIKKRIDNDMANASLGNIQVLKEAAVKYINGDKKNESSEVQKAIKKFIREEVLVTFSK
ncbi:patatin-like phospholipase family protein [Scytonema hofmannii FACHB-248]|uniref:Patatin-like phospholipase family protein n=1 Tax=Scytonema hofmannii FACHB-248 TaxID=1842502 RepID=A0ABR8GPU4_9CYAN|nr:MULTISPECIES: patatin-like phospholipase family protein [Nostocales]MBD2605242.1 patatin-like phospholipase family protein [Scytonema hofmannii FACHB-248]